MRNKRLLGKALLLVCTFAIVCLSGISLLACNDVKSTSKEIFIDDFSGTYTISVKAKVKNHSILPNAFRTFEYAYGIDKLYDTIIKAPHYSQFVHIDNDIIFVDLVDSGNRTYSCIIYPSDKKNTFIVHSMTYTLGQWANHQSLFFPAYTLDKDINPSDSETTTYICEYDIETLKEYYIKRGYYAEIKNNTLYVICLLRYPSVFEGEEGEYGRKAISWSVIYESDNSIRFADVENKYV